MLCFLLIICMLFSLVSSVRHNAYYDSDGKFKIPYGVYILDFSIEGGHSNLYHGYAFTGSLAVTPGEKLRIQMGSDSSDLCGSNVGSSTRIYNDVNDTLLVLAAGAGLYSKGATFTNNYDGLGGEGVSGCGTFSYYDLQVLEVSTTNSGGNPFVQFFWNSQCNEEQVDLLNTDFTPNILSSSSLYRNNDIRLLQIDLSLPLYYYNVSIDFSDQHSITPCLFILDSVILRILNGG